MNGNTRDNIKVGMKVKVVEKHNQNNNNLTSGVVKQILTNAKVHPYGIKVRLEDGTVGRVKEII